MRSDEWEFPCGLDQSGKQQSEVAGRTAGMMGICTDSLGIKGQRSTVLMSRKP